MPEAFLSSPQICGGALLSLRSSKMVRLDTVEHGCQRRGDTNFRLQCFDLFPDPLPAFDMLSGLQAAECSGRWRGRFWTVWHGASAGFSSVTGVG